MYDGPLTTVIRIGVRLDEDFQVQAAWDEGREKLVLYVCNRTGTLRKASFDLSALGRSFSTCDRRMLVADGPAVMNTLADPDAIRRVSSRSKAKVRKGIYAVEVPAWSFTEFVLGQ